MLGLFRHRRMLRHCILTHHICWWMTKLNFLGTSEVPMHKCIKCPSFTIRLNPHVLLVGGDWNHGILNDCPFSWECHHPNWRSPSFFRGVGWNHQPVWLSTPIFVVSIPIYMYICISRYIHIHMYIYIIVYYSIYACRGQTPIFSIFGQGSLLVRILFSMMPGEEDATWPELWTSLTVPAKKYGWWPSGKLSHNYGKSPCLVGKSR